MMADEYLTEDASLTFAKALSTGRGPDVFIWKACRAANANPDRQYDTHASEAKEALAESLRTRRDACTYCGVRTDKHREFGCRKVLL